MLNPYVLRDCYSNAYSVFPFSFVCLEMEIAVWRHCLTVLCSYAAMVRKEIQDETDRITGKSKQISPVPIHLSIYSPNGNVI